MGVQERKAKEKEELKELILNAAMALFVEKGIEQTTIRSIADSINYSIGTVYVYFKDKNEILYAIHSLGFKRLRQYFADLQNIENPKERLSKMGIIYVKFAMENSSVYDLMFNLNAPMKCLSDKHENEWNEGKAAFDVLRSTVQECISMGYFKGHAAEPMAFLVWSMVHGMCSLEIRKRTQGGFLANPETIVQDSYCEFLKILEVI